MIIIRNLSFAAVIGSMLSLERVMLGTFGDAQSLFTLQMEAATGAGAFVLLLMLAAGLFIRARRII